MTSAGRNMAFLAGSTAIFTAGLSAALRAATASDIKADYFDAIDAVRSATMIGTALGAAFLGFSLMLVVTSTLLDRIGMKPMLIFAAMAFGVGSLLVMASGTLGGMAGYHQIVAGMFVTGLGWGATEGTVNPMVAALYPEDTTHRMNGLHAWWPAGLIVGGLAGISGVRLGIDWRFILALVPLCAVVFGLLCAGAQFPLTTGAQLGVSRRDQFREVFRRRGFFIWFVLMFLTAAAELAPGQWVDVALTQVVGMRGIWLLVYVSAIQFIGRHFSGAITRNVLPEGLLCVSSVLAAIGLFGLSGARSPGAALAAATIWGLGVCYLWPTMIATVAKRYPRGGALSIGLMGFAGSLSIYFVLPALGAIYDSAKLEAAGGAPALATLSPERLGDVLIFAASQSFRAVALIPAVLVIAFALLWLAARRDAGKGSQ